MAAPPISKLKEDIGIQRDQRKAFLPLTSELLKRKHWPGRDRPGSPGSLFRKPDSQNLSPIKLLIERYWAHPGRVNPHSKMKMLNLGRGGVPLASR
jgi:hypothetical protein